MHNNHHHHQSDPSDRKQISKQFNEANLARKAANDTQFFWDLVNKNKSHHYQFHRKVNKNEEKVLFGKKNDSAERGEIDDSIPVERSGPRSDEIEVLQTFVELKERVPTYVSNNIALMKYEKPTPIQKHSIPLGLAGLDLMCCAQTGSGKTFAFLLPVVARLDAKVPEGTPERISVDNRGSLPRCIILAPTRELASQIHLDARRLIFTSKLKAVCVYGGNDLRGQLVELSTGCDIIVATPGRLNDLVDRGCVSLSEVCFFILDEADRMLDMGFEPQIRRIVADYDMPSRDNRQTFMFSATFPPEIQTLAREFLRDYVWIGVGRVGSTVENIKQVILLANGNPNEKIKLLIDAINSVDGRTLVFVQKKMTATWLCQCLNVAYGVSAEEIHGDRSQSQRESALRQFRDGYIRILVATDVAARGLDVPQVTHVIQFDMPQSPEDFDVYVHRIGRTGRAGKSGTATSFYVPGRDVGEGNGKIAHLIYRLLQENKQEIPEWFANSDDLRYSNRASNGYKKPYGNSNGYSNGQNHKFGWRDVRSNHQSTTYNGGSSNGVNGNAVPTNGAGYSAYQNQGQYQSQQGGYAGSYYSNGVRKTNNDYNSNGTSRMYQHQQAAPQQYDPNGYVDNYYTAQQYQSHGDVRMSQGYTASGYYDQYSGYNGIGMEGMVDQFNNMSVGPTHPTWAVPPPGPSRVPPRGGHYGSGGYSAYSPHQVGMEAADPSSYHQYGGNGYAVNGNYAPPAPFVPQGQYRSQNQYNTNRYNTNNTTSYATESGAPTTIEQPAAGSVVKDGSANEASA